MTTMNFDTPKRKWKIENGIGHWEVMYKGVTISCDDGELSEVTTELINFHVESEKIKNG